MSTRKLAFRRMQAHFTFTLFSIGIATLICGTCCAQTTQENVSPSSVAADRAYEELMSAASYEELEKVAANWKKELSEQTLTKLLARLFLLGASTEAEPKELLSLVDGRGNERHDLRTRLGRAAWGIEQLLDIEISILSFNQPTDLPKKVPSMIIDPYNEQLRKFVKKRIDAFSVSERLEQAKSPKPLLFPTEVLTMIDVLADDTNPEVRLAALESKWLDPRTIGRRQKLETDPNIKKVLVLLSSRAFAILTDFPKPDGW